MPRQTIKRKKAGALALLLIAALLLPVCAAETLPEEGGEAYDALAQEQPELSEESLSEAEESAPIEEKKVNYSTIKSYLTVNTGTAAYWDAELTKDAGFFTKSGNLYAQAASENVRLKEGKQDASERSTLEHNVSDMNNAVKAFVGNAEQSDDLTMLFIQYTKKQRPLRLKRSITLPNDVQTIPDLNRFVEQVAEELGYDMSATMNLNLALEEAVVNVMNYAYPPGTEGEVNIAAEANDLRLKFIITDNGVPFDPTAKEDADTTLSAEDRPIGGLGIYLVRQLMDSMNYERLNGQNILTLRKKLEVNLPSANA